MTSCKGPTLSASREGLSTRVFQADNGLAGPMFEAFLAIDRSTGYNELQRQWLGPTICIGSTDGRRRCCLQKVSVRRLTRWEMFPGRTPIKVWRRCLQLEMRLGTSTKVCGT